MRRIQIFAVAVVLALFPLLHEGSALRVAADGATACVDTNASASVATDRDGGCDDDAPVVSGPYPTSADTDGDCVGDGQAVSDGTDQPDQSHVSGADISASATPDPATPVGTAAPGTPQIATGSIAVIVYQCPPQANPERGDLLNCVVTDDAKAELIDTSSHVTVTLDTAPRRRESRLLLGRVGGGHVSGGRITSWETMDDGAAGRADRSDACQGRDVCRHAE